MKKDLEFGIRSQMITKEALAKRIKEFGEEITEDIKGADAESFKIIISTGKVLAKDKNKIYKEFWSA